MLLQLFLQLALPILFIFILWRARFSHKAEWLANIIPLAIGIAFVFITARWDMFSYYLRWVGLIAFSLAVYKSYDRITEDPEESYTLKWGNLLPTIIAVVFLGWLTMNSLLGYIPPKGAVDLAYPLQGRAFYIGGGGNSPWINAHQRAYAQSYALDILALNIFGSSSDVFRSGELDRYTIFGEPIYSPCNGTVIDAIDGFPDQPIGSRDEVNLAGNYVTLDCEGVAVLLAHMQMGSVEVQTGDAVTIGQLLGRVGNSGNTSQPHLHIHATTGSTVPNLLDGEPVPITFDGRFLVRNQLFNGN
ncbi:MAG: M23 family peptidase [Chloroflexi bacterium]|nr:MAG: M23 family peptidase [Chloroflexota bacterium]MBL1196688.1 M23 family metallopeptidase [Chloroflexota bacterium]NOH13981.1 M23 family metallopeptidase [Chloroflexota bacterium]